MGRPANAQVCGALPGAGRQFYKCATTAGGCNFFAWADAVNGSGPSHGGGSGYGAAPYTGGPPPPTVNPYAAPPAGVYGSSLQGNANANPYAYSSAPLAGAGGADYGAGASSGAYGNAAPYGAGDTGSGGEGALGFVKCMCQVDAPVKTSNSAKNPGRQFYAWWVTAGGRASGLLALGV